MEWHCEVAEYYEFVFDDSSSLQDLQAFAFVYCQPNLPG